MILCFFLLGAGEDADQIVKNIGLGNSSVLILKPEIDWV